MMKQFEEFITQNLKYAEGILIIIVGFFLVSIVLQVFKLIVDKRFVRDQGKMAILEKFIKYITNLTFLIFGLRHMGFDLKILLGAAGVFTVALGFASQTSASNLISGIFLLAERPFKRGDIIKIGETRGLVMSIDLLSTRLRTFDNVFIRIPNENLMKSQIENYTHYPIRRVDLYFSVDYEEDLRRVEDALRRVAERIPDCLHEPLPKFLIKGLGESGIEIKFSVWSTRDKFLDVKNSVYLGILDEFRDQQISIPYPHRVMLRKEIL